MTSSASFAVWATYTRALARWTAAWSKPPALRWAGRSMSVCRCSTIVGPLHVMPINPDQALRTGGSAGGITNALMPQAGPDVAFGIGRVLIKAGEELRPRALTIPRT